MAHGTAEKGQSVPSLLQRAAFLCMRGRHEDALAAAKEALRHATPPDLETEKSDTVLQARCLTQIGAAQAASGRRADAIQTLRDALCRNPDAVEALIGLAIVLKTEDAIHVPDSIKLLKRARALDPDNTEVLSNLSSTLTDVGVRLKNAGLPASAIEHYNEALSVMPQYGQAYYNLGVAYADSGLSDEAMSSYKKCIQLHPGHVEAWCNLGVLHRNAGRLEDAVECYNRALSSNPNFELAKRNLAVALCERGTALKTMEDRKGARALYKRALALCPNFADAHYNMGVSYVEEGKLERALASYSLAVHFNENLTEAHNNLGVVHKDLGNLEKSVECYKKALSCDQQHHRTHNNLAVVYTLLGNTELATSHLQMAITICPQYAEAHNNIGVLLRDEGDIDEAIKAYETCIKLDPRADMASQNRLHALNYSDHWSKEEVFQEHRKWGEAFQSRIDAEVSACVTISPTNSLAAKVEAWAADPPRPDPNITRGLGTNRPLRVAYLSPDFFTHSVSYFAEVLLANHSADAVTVFAYANVAQTDAKTERLRNYPSVQSRWRNIWGMTSVQVAELIISDEIDILIELAGHTANNRLDVMALRLAPLQLTWIGYPNTTGLSSIHYRVTDGTVDPEATSQKFTEKLWRLPETFLCYTPSVDAPAVAPPPCELSGGIITFGSFNVLAKCQPKTIKLWAKILKGVPNSRLLIKAKPLGTMSAKRRLEKQFEAEGVSANRLDLVPLILATSSHLQAYSNMDVGLDPFPYAGTTTTCEALYMGVPVITMGVRSENGDHAHSVGVSLLTTVGHPELIAYTDEEYVEKAVALATDLQRLKQIRKSLRHDMMSSALGRHKSYVDAVEAMFFDMWEERGGRIERSLDRAMTKNKRGTDELSDRRSASSEDEDEPKLKRHNGINGLCRPSERRIELRRASVEVGDVIRPLHEVRIDSDEPLTEQTNGRASQKLKRGTVDLEMISEDIKHAEERSTRRHKSSTDSCELGDLKEPSEVVESAGELVDVIAPLHDVHIGDEFEANVTEKVSSPNASSKRRQLSRTNSASLLKDTSEIVKEAGNVLDAVKAAV